MQETLSIRTQSYNALYQALKDTTFPIVNKLFSENHFFSLNATDELRQIHAKYRHKPLRFLQVLQKYYMMATMGQNKYPFAHTLPFMHMAWLLWIRRKRTFALINNYKDIYLEKISRFEKMLPDIDFSDNHKHMIKVILANTLSVFINQPVLKNQSHRKALHKAFQKGFYVGITYVVADLSLDAGILSEELKPEFHQRILHALSNVPVEPHENPLLHFIHVIQQEAERDLPFSENEYIYKTLYLLEKAQYEERHFDVDHNSIKSVIDKTVLLALKTHCTLMSIRFNNDIDLQKGMYDGILWSLYCQLTDDFRDFHQDKKEGLITLFTGYKQGESVFNPYTLYLHLTHYFSKQYHAKWLYKDMLEYLYRNENPDTEALEDKKAAIFIKRLTGIDLKDFSRNY